MFRFWIAPALAAFIISGCVGVVSQSAPGDLGQAKRGQGTRRTFDAPLPQVHDAALYVLNRYRDSGWVVHDSPDALQAAFDRPMVHMAATVFLEPGIGGTQTEAVYEARVLGYDARRKSENDLLNYIADTLDAARAKGATTSSAPVPKPVASDIDQPPVRSAKHPNDFALIIGIGKYQSLPEASFGEWDAELFQRYAQATLGIPEENIVFLVGPQATRTGIAKYLEEWLPRNVTADSRVWFFYSGHGAPDPASGTSYLVPWDGDPSFLETSAYPVPKLYERLGALKAKEVVVALDSCFSGAGGRSVLAKGARPLVTVHSVIPGSTKVSVLAAASGSEIAGGLDDKGHGMFSYYLLKGLKGEAANSEGHVTLESLYSYLSSNVRRAARRQNREQTPQLSTHSAALKLY